MARVETGARLHFGFQNLSLAHPRLYGGVGASLADPRIIVEAEPADSIRCDDSDVTPYLERAVESLDVDGATLTVVERFERHVGLGSGTQLALACLAAVAKAYDYDVDVRKRAPQLGRGGRSGVGVATFESGGFAIDAGHPTARFTTAPPAEGTWNVPEPVVQRPLPETWRFVLISPDTGERGPSGRVEEQQLRRVVERADPGIADDIATLLTRRLLPAIAAGDHDAFGSAVARLGRLNGAWYADEQGGVYRPPAGELVEALADSPAITGAGQSSWGPTVYGVTQADTEEKARTAAQQALEDIDAGGSVRVTAPTNRGAIVGE